MLGTALAGAAGVAPKARLPREFRFGGEQYHYDARTRCFMSEDGNMITEERAQQTRLGIVNGRITNTLSDASIARYAKHKQACAYCRGTLGADSQGECRGCGAPL
jgi:hypothetical protein